jgi:predicted dehydrogenase
MKIEPGKLRWGILSTAQIGKKNWKAIRNSGNGVVTAVASRDAARCTQFVAECQGADPFAETPRALGSYEALLDAADVDAVYIPLPTGLRKEWVLRAAAAGKHVVCEKPCALSVADLREMIAACERHQVQFMDGVMHTHSRRLEAMRARLDDGETVGQVRRINAAFHFNAAAEFLNGNIRTHGMLEPDGCVGDQGWYCIRFALWVMGWTLPRRVSGRILAEHARPDGGRPVPVEFSGELFFDGGVTATFYCSFLTELEQHVTVSGTRGYLRLTDFVVPADGKEIAFETGRAGLIFQGSDCIVDVKTRRWTVDEPSHGQPGAQETNLFRNFAAAVLAGKRNEAWPQMALKTQLVMEACLKSARAGSGLVELADG